jgi:hypothetical protein
MVDFKRLVERESVTDFTNLISLFESLDRHATHTELRPAQQEALEAVSSRRTEGDLILKVSTGAGKTVIGLLYLLSHMHEKKEPVVYLCPTRQLMEQVQNEAERLGIKVHPYTKGEKYPHVECTTAQAILICTYDKLFNAKTTFDRTDVMLRPTAFVLDDAHAGVEEIRDAFTLYVSDGFLKKALMSVFSEHCKTYKPGIWSDIEAGDPNGVIEIPFWIWKNCIGRVSEALTKYQHDDEYQFVIPYLLDLLRWCRCVISGIGIEIVPEILPIYKSQAFDTAPHRLFMSATLADDSVLVRELACSDDSAKKPIVPTRDRGLGERMVLAPSLVDSSLDRSWVMQLCKSLSPRMNVVVLSPSEAKAKDWKGSGAKVVTGDHVAAAVEDLRSSRSLSRYYAFAQRYDGIDLPDNACRVLVIDGLPFGEGIIDRYDAIAISSTGGLRNRIIYRIEQGMGRAVRSHADYAVVILCGSDIAHFIAKHDVLAAMNPETRAQLKLALDLARLATEETEPSKAVLDMIRQCLQRDEGWKQFYNERIRKLGHSNDGITDTSKIAVANAERKAFSSALANDFNRAVTVLRDVINTDVNEEPSKGWFLQRVANYLFEVDPGGAFEVQRAAFEKNRFMLCPPGTVKRPPVLAKFGIQENLVGWFKQFENPNGAIAAIEELRLRLSIDRPANTFEQAICDLGDLLGADSSRPEKEYGQGPDDLWLWGEMNFVLEAKTENEQSLHKKDAGQLELSLRWYERSLPMRSAPQSCMVAKVNKADRNAGFSSSTCVLMPEGIDRLINSLLDLVRAMISDAGLISNLKLLAQRQEAFKLMPDQFKSAYTVPIETCKD